MSKDQVNGSVRVVARMDTGLVIRRYRIPNRSTRSRPTTPFIHAGSVNWYWKYPKVGNTKN